MQGPREQAARLPVSLPPRPLALAGREDLLALLHDLLTAEGPPRTVTLSGMGGVGKTSLAAEYAHRHLTEIGIVWQIPAEEPLVAEQSMAELAAQAGGRDLADPRGPVASVHAVLAASPVPWLLIFDNAPDETSARRFLPPAGRGRIVVTSQSQHWAGAQVLYVPVLDTEAAARFLADRAGDPDQEAAAELARELGGLPLALEQAAAYVRAAGMPVADYLGLFRQRRAELLERGMPSAHPASVAATLAMAASRLEQDEPTAAGLLRLLACLAPEPIPLALLLTATAVPAGLDPDVTAVVGRLAGDRLAAADAVTALRRYSLVTLALNGMVLVHPLVQAVAVDQLPAGLAEHWRAAAAALVEHAIPADPQSRDAWSACADLLPHALAVLELTSAGIRRTASALGEGGLFATARDLFRNMAGAYQQSAAYGPQHPDTLAVRASLAYWTGLAGDPVAARDQHAGLLPDLECVLGAEHPETLTVRDGLARWTGEAGDPATARDLYAALLPDLERVLGAEHPDTLTHRCDFAYWTGEAGDPAAARDLCAVLLPVRERVSGPDDTYTLTVRMGLAHRTGEAGDPATARDLSAALLPVRERVSGPEHPHTLIVRAHVARWTGEAGDPATARDLYAALLPVRERILGAEHPYTLGDRAYLARWTGEAGDPATARDLYAALVPVRERVLGAEHPETVAARDGLAHWTHQVDLMRASRE